MIVGKPIPQSSGGGNNQEGLIGLGGINYEEDNGIRIIGDSCFYARYYS